MLELSEDVMRFYEERLKSFTELKARDPASFNGLTDPEYMDRVIKHVFSVESSLSSDDMKTVVDLIYDKTRSGLGVLGKYVRDDSVNEIMVNGPDNIFIEDRNGIHRVESRLSSVEELEEIIRNIASFVHREINEMEPILDARLDDGSRVNAVFKNIAAGGPILTIRKFSKEKIRLADMTESGTITREAADFLIRLVRARYNIFISGGTSSGKTTFLNALSDYIPDGSRVIIIEDSRELMMDSIDDLIQMECHNANSLGKGRVTMDMLIRTSLRMRPDRIIVGEVRGSEVAEMLQAMNTGHDGSMSTGHGNSVKGMLRRLEAMYIMSADIPIDAVRSQITEGIDIMVHLSRLDTGIRKVTEIDELLGYENGDYTLNRLYSLDEHTMELVPTGNKLKYLEKMRMNGGIHEHP